MARSTAFLNTETTEDGGRVDAKGQAVRPVHVAPTDRPIRLPLAPRSTCDIINATF
jgi:hypothetical protein